MYKRLSLKNILCKTSSINLIVFGSFFLSFQNNWSQTNVTNNYSNDTIVVVITNENKEDGSGKAITEATIRHGDFRNSTSYRAQPR